MKMLSRVIARLDHIGSVILQALARLGAYLRKHRRAVFVMVSVIIICLLAWVAYLRWFLGWEWADWTGFGNYAGAVEKDNRGRTLWDWMGLLIIPIILSLGAFGLERSARANERKIAEQRRILDLRQAALRNALEQQLADQRRQDDQERVKDQQRETSLQAYFDKMTALLLDEKQPLRKSAPTDEIRVVARTSTLTTLRGLDPERKGMLLKFLSEASLINWVIISENEDGVEGVLDLTEGGPVIRLANADLSGADLHAADLQGDDLSEANLCEANFGGADLRWCSLRLANLRGANLRGSNMLGVSLTNEHILEQYNMRRTDLIETDLSGADLYKADLTDAKVTNEQLATVSNLKDAIMTDGQKFNPAIHTFWKGAPDDTGE